MNNRIVLVIVVLILAVASTSLYLDITATAQPPPPTSDPDHAAIEQSLADITTAIASLDTKVSTLTTQLGDVIGQAAANHSAFSTKVDTYHAAEMAKLDEILAKIGGTTPPPTTGTSLTIAWDYNEPQSPPQSGFRVERSDDGGQIFSTFTELGDVRTYTDPLLTTPGTYFYRVRAFRLDANGIMTDLSEPSNTVSGTIVASSNP